MSAVIAYVDGGKVYFATDTQRTSGSFRYSAAAPTSANVFFMPHGVLCSAVRSQKIKQIIMAHPEWFDGLAEQPLTKQYVLENILPDLYEFMDGFELVNEESKKNGITEFEGAILLAQKDTLLCIDGDFSVIVIPKFCIIGSDPAYCYARVASYHHEIELKEMLLGALLDVKKYCNTVSAPYYLYVTDSEEKELLGGKRG